MTGITAASGHHLDQKYQPTLFAPHTSACVATLPGSCSVFCVEFSFTSDLAPGGDARRLGCSVISKLNGDSAEMSGQ